MTAIEVSALRSFLLLFGFVMARGDCTIETRTLQLAPAQETALSLALREAATNVIRHAAATKCHIRFYAQDGSALMEVQDDGRGAMRRSEMV